MKKRSASRDAQFSLRVLIGFTLSSVGVFLALLALSVNSSTTAAAASKLNNGFTVVYPTHADISKPLRDMEPWPVQRVQEHEAAENPKIVTGVHKDAPDTVVQSSMLHQLAPSIPAPILNFAGIPFPGVVCNCAPPDTNGEVGATQYVQIVNEGYQVFDKNTGASVFGPASIASIWSGFGGACQTAGQGDPVVLYDQIANRWLVSQFANGLHDECVAVSTTSDATGSYARYDFPLVPLGGNNLYDYPKIGVWPDAYYMSMNVFNSSGTAYLGPQAFAFDRTKMLAGDPTATAQAAPRLAATFPPMLPADIDGSTLPPNGAPNSFVLLPDTNFYRIYHYHVDFANPANSTFTFFGQSPAAPWTQICPFTRACVPQLGTADRVDAIGDRLMFRAAYRNFGDHEAMVSNFTVSGAGGVAGIRWFELRGLTAGPISTFQEGTYQPDTTYRWMGSIAQDGSGNMALGFSASDSTIHPQIRYTGRMAGDTLGQMTLGEAHIIDGAGSQTDTVNRWGDYSDMTIDPVDDATFWYTQEYYDTTTSFNWRTRIASFKLATSAGDTVTIGKAIYSTANSQLQVQATDSNPAAVLTVKVTSSGQTLGTMQTRGDGRYQLKVRNIANPVNITVTSNLGGSDSANVRVR
jgi:hypothetical protein